MRSLAILVLLSAACSRDLARLSEREPEPAFLGELSGVYAGFISMDEAEREALGGSIWVDEMARRASGVPVPPGAPPLEDLPVPIYAPVEELIYLANLVTEAGLGGTIVAVLLPPGALDDDRDAAPPGAFVNGPLLGGTMAEDGTLAVGTSPTEPPLTGRRAPGGAGFHLESFYRICAGGARHRLNTARTCEFNPALSGLYATTVSKCDGGDPQSTYLGLGFVEDTVLGVRYPELSHMMLGSYNRFEQGGLNLNFSTGSDPTHIGFFGLEESGGELTYYEQLFRYGGETCDEQRIGKRLSGGEHRTCAVPDPNVINLRAIVSYAGALRRDVIVNLVTPEGARLGAYDFGSATLLRSVDSGEVVLPDALPAYGGADPPYTARYSDLPAGDYELFAVDLDGRDDPEPTRNFAPRMAIPRCVSVPGT